MLTSGYEESANKYRKLNNS